jgi:hypothetical protein
MSPEIPPSYRAARVVVALALLLAICVAAYAVVDSSLPTRVRAAATRLGDWARGAWEDS